MNKAVAKFGFLSAQKAALTRQAVERSETEEGWLYLSAVIDLYSRAIVGWSMKDSLRKDLIMDDWKMAKVGRTPSKRLLHHSDLGSQYTSQAYLDLLRDQGRQISMSGRGNCCDNACVESFFATHKAECADRTFETKRETRTAIFEYIETWYNRRDCIRHRAI